MKKITTLWLSAILVASATISAYAQDRYVVFFSNKNNTPYSVSNPSAFLSQRAINRRQAQNISVTIQDLPVDPAFVSGVTAQGGQVLNVSKWFNSATVRITSPTILQNIQSLPYVTQVLNVGRLANPNKSRDKFQIERIPAATPVNPPVLRTTSFNYGNSLNQVTMLKGDLMHDNGYIGTGVQIAVIDAGFLNANTMVAFDSLRANNQILSTWDFVDGETDVYNDDWHGSMVLSTIGANVPGDIIGTAPGASFYLLRSEDAQTENIIEEYNWSSAAEYADSAGADVINSSLGYTEFDDPSMNHTYADLDGHTTPITRAANIAASKGMIVCNSAGNEGNSAWFHISAPSDADSILGVAAVDNLGLYATFSGKGPASDGSIKPNVAAQGAGTFVADPFNGTGSFPANGTSFSSPLTAGMVATLWQCHPNATNMQIIQAIQQSASQHNAPDSLLGYGIPDYPLACLILGGIDSGITTNVDQLNLAGTNPFNTELALDFYSAKRQTINVSLTNMLGQSVYVKSFTVNGISMNRIIIPANFADGLYILQVESESKVFSKNVMRY